MTPLRSALSIVARLTVLTLLATQLAAAAEGSQVTCAAGKPDCGSTARIAACCCAGNTEASQKKGPVVPIVRVDSPAAVTSALPRQLTAADTRALSVPDAFATRIPQDLIILLANLRV